MLAVIVFVSGIYAAGWLGIDMAKMRSAPDTEEISPDTEKGTLTIGSTSAPVYLASSPDSLRTFFAQYPTVEGRASASITDSGIRRVTGTINLVIVESEADATKIKVASGAIAGAVYWIHYSQLEESPEDDSILSPVPE